jgi:hypothetical protein
MSWVKYNIIMVLGYVYVVGLLFYSHKLFRASKWTVKTHWIQLIECKDYLNKIALSQTITSILSERRYKPRNNLSLNILVSQLN